MGWGTRKRLDINYTRRLCLIKKYLMNVRLEKVMEISPTGPSQSVLKYNLLKDEIKNMLTLYIISYKC